ncbi:B12-binding domain-containing radical SAM protein [Sinorhizobium meliloti]|uniref:B12-binding domain-containing radical SAM protein n=1 Tax=Rhizobium meliloti TaxID=382 RepID=UPI001295B02D|nr:radical SAM protein [Sinorhizobium meliloti]MDX0698047.1 radical SAM protein [Sinorhizobium medicae]MDX0747659.1 radical SAM protein [Sinorhizobium medicae]MQX93320.1 radical SAM protein [Sinorhizobium meliloti]
MTAPDVLVIAPFRQPTFRFGIAADYNQQEPWDSPPFQMAGAVEAAGFSAGLLQLINIFPGYNEEVHGEFLSQFLRASQAKVVLFATDYFIASRSTAALYGIRRVIAHMAQSSLRPLFGVTGRIATVLGRRLFEFCPDLDFLVAGEVENVIGPALGNALRRDREALAAHPNVLVNGSGTRAHAEAAFLSDPSATPLPAYHLAGDTMRAFERVFGAPPQKIPFSIRTSLGCRLQCRFCAGVPNWNRYRLKSAERVAAEIDLLTKHCGAVARLSFLEDELFTVDDAHVDAVCALLKRRGLVLDGVYTHSAFLTRRSAAALAGVTRHVYFGLDSADDALLKHMKKGQRFESVLAAIELAEKAGLAVALEWIIGSPGETRDNLIHSLNMIYNLLVTGTVDNINTYVYCPHPGTEFAEAAGQYGIEVLSGFDWIQESGGFPAALTQTLTRNEIFTAYLMSQLVIREAKEARHKIGPAQKVSPANYPYMRQLLGMIAEADKAAEHPARATEVSS